MPAEVKDGGSALARRRFFFGLPTPPKHNQKTMLSKLLSVGEIEFAGVPYLNDDWK